jgi:acetate kinase
MPRTVLVINSGSTSLKYQLIDVHTATVLAAGLVERIGEAEGVVKHSTGSQNYSLTRPVPTHNDGLAAVLDLFQEHGPDLAKSGLVAVGHRVVQGGDVFDQPVLIDDSVEQQIEDLAALAPLHNPPNLQGIRGARAAFANLPHVAVFDTAFHRTLPPEAYTYALPRELAKKHRIRRYGMHGTSHRYVSRELARLIGKPVDQINSIIIHIGGGGSICAVKAGRSVEISMGLTPLEGLVMGTRCGDIDPAVLFHLHREAGLSFAELDNLCNKQSGLLGLAGASDMRDVRRAASNGETAAQIAVDVFTHRVRSYVGAYWAQLGHLDAIAFTAGIGENDDAARAESLAGLAELGIAIDPALNNGLRGGPARISPSENRIQVWVVPTNEELEIAREAVELLD